MPSFQTKQKKRKTDYLERFAPDCQPNNVLLDFKIAPIFAFQKLVSESHEVVLALKVIPALVFGKNVRIAGTTNAVKGWHYGIQALFSRSHPEIGKFCLSYKKRCCGAKGRLFECLIRAKNPNKRKY